MAVGPLVAAEAAVRSSRVWAVGRSTGKSTTTAAMAKEPKLRGYALDGVWLDEYSFVPATAIAMHGLRAQDAVTLRP